MSRVFLRLSEHAENSQQNSRSAIEGTQPCREVDCVWNVMAHAQKPDFVFRRNGRIHLKRRGRQFSRLLAAEVCASAVVMLDTPSSKVVWRVLATHFIRQVFLHFPSRASPCAIRFQTHYTSLSPDTHSNGKSKRRNIPPLSCSRIIQC